MATEDFTLQGIRSFDDLIVNSGEGKWLMAMLRSAGLVAESSNAFASEEVRAFPKNLNSLVGESLGNAQLYWQYHLGRVTEMLGLMDSLMADEDLLLKRARAKAKSVVLRELIEASKVEAAESDKSVTVKLTKDQLDALVEDDENIQSIEDRKARLHRMTIVLKAWKEAYGGYCAVLSREVTRRGDMMKAGL